MADQLAARVERFVRDVLAAMELPLEVVVEEGPDALRLNLMGEEGELLVRRKGETLDALQHILNTVFRRELEDGRHIVLDCLDFRKSRDAELRQMARFLVEKARSTGVPQEIGPLNPYARRIVHLAVAEDPTAASESVGDAFLKTVVISTRSTPRRS